jgi:hypothetical protein
MVDIEVPRTKVEVTQNDILDFIDVFDKQYNYTTTEEYYDRHKPKPFEFEVNVI